MVKSDILFNIKMYSSLSLGKIHTSHIYEGYSQKGFVRTELDIYVLLLSLSRYLYLWSFSTRVYHPPISQFFGIDMVYDITLCLKFQFVNNKQLLPSYEVNIESC